MRSLLSFLALTLWSPWAQARVGACDANFTLRRAAQAHLDHFWRFVERDETYLQDVRKPEHLTGSLVLSLALTDGRFCLQPDQAWTQSTTAIRGFTFRGGLADADLRFVYANNEITFGDDPKAANSYVYHAVGGVASVGAVEFGALGLIQGTQDGPGGVSGWSFTGAAPYVKAEVTLGDGLDRARLTGGPLPAGPIELTGWVERIQPLEVTVVGVGMVVPLVVDDPGWRWLVDAAVSSEVESPSVRRAHLGTEIDWPPPRVHTKDRHGWRLNARGEASLFDGTHVVGLDGPELGGLVAFDFVYQAHLVLLGAGAGFAVVPERLEFLPGATPLETTVTFHIGSVGGWDGL